MTTRLAERQRPGPDVLVVQVDADTDPHLTDYPAAAVVLVVEVVSPDSAERDRERKPQLYAQTDIPHFWRVENVDGRPTVYVYERDPGTGDYVATGIHHDRLQVPVPWDIDIDLAAIDDL